MLADRRSRARQLLLALHQRWFRGAAAGGGHHGVSARIRIRTSCVLPSDRRVLPRCQVAAAITPACPPPCAQCVSAHWYAQCLIGFASPVIPHACLIEGPRDGGRIGNRPETRGGARASVDQCRPGQWTGGYYGAFARGNGPILAGRENRIVCRLGAVAGGA